MDKTEVLRYLGARGDPGPEAAALIDSCARELAAAAGSAYTYSIVSAATGGGVLLDDRVLILSRDLEAHLAGCGKAAVFAATLGVSTEYVLYRYGRTDVSRAAVLHACAAALIEELCDKMENEIAGRAWEEGLFIRPRSSPGYGDFSLSHQRDIAALTRCGSRIGVGVTESLLLTPSKSVTGIIGLSRQSIREAKSCGGCGMRETCEYRRRGACCR